MTDQNHLQTSLEFIRQTKGDFEFWSARDLMLHLGYSTWESFKTAIARAQEACRNTNQEVSDHFRDATKMVFIGSNTQRSIEDILLTRYACYLIAQNGDPRKIERTVYQRGITQSYEFATFKNKHIEALYGGINTPDLKKRRGIPKGRALADFDTDVELKAKNFALGMTDHNIRTQNLTGRDKLEREVIANSAATRNALLARSIVPENLAPEEDIKKIERRRAKEQKAIKKDVQLQLSDPEV